jgi:Cys-tRNA(Pro) deacylase
LPGKVRQCLSFTITCRDPGLSKPSETPATVMLKKYQVAYTEHLYDYVEHGGTAVSSSTLGVDEHHVVKTLIFEDDARRPLCVLMHGDRKVSTKELARQIGAKRVAPCKPEDATRHSGYQIGGCSPFGLRKPMPVYMEASILGVARILINGGKRGFLVGLSPQEVARLVNPKLVSVALTE